MENSAVEIDANLTVARTHGDRPKILCVDDDPNILDGFRRNLRKNFFAFTANGPVDGLAAIAQYGPFAVVLSDFQMPGMDGVQFLTKVRGIAPDTVRILLTAQTDVSVAMSAVNQGCIFRFLLKPCVPFILEKVLLAGVVQHNLLVAEKQLTRETIVGCVQVLVELFGRVKPEALGRTNRIHEYVQQIASEMGLREGSISDPNHTDHSPADLWQLEVAALLSQLGRLTLPPELLAKLAKHGGLSEMEVAELGTHLTAAGRMFKHIPRLDVVSRIIERQQLAYRDLHSSDPKAPIGAVDVFAQILKAATEFDVLRLSGLSNNDALKGMSREDLLYMPEALSAIASIARGKEANEIFLVAAYELKAGMKLEEDLRFRNGMVLLGSGQTVTDAFVHRLQRADYDLSREVQCKVRILYT